MNGVAEPPEVMGRLFTGLVMVATPLRVDAAAGVTPAAARPANVPRRTSTAATPTFMRRTVDSRVLPDPASR